METVECVHREHMTTGENHTELGVCSKCGQTVVYDRSTAKGKATLTKLGRVDGKVVLPKPAFDLDLSGKDRADLTLTHMQAANSKHPPAAEEAAGNIPPRPRGDPEAQREWYKKYKKRLIDEFLSLGVEAFLEKYPIPHQLISHLKGDKYYKKLVEGNPPVPAARAKATKAKPGRPKAGKSGVRPQFPEWSNTWPPETQVAWLTIFEKHFM